MRTKRLYVLIAVIVLISLIYAVPSAATTDGERIETGTDLPITDGETLVEENSNYIMYINTTDCNIRIKNKNSGDEVTANPLNFKDDTVAAGAFRTHLRSQMIISYTTDKLQQKVTNSFVSCISRQAYTIKKIDHGVLVNYKFPSEGFYIPVRYILNDRGLNASILFSDIKENKDNKLDTISFLPYLGAGDMNDEGFMLVPDGSGAIIYMNNGKTNCYDYSKPFYGRDYSLYQPRETSNEQRLALAVFGVVKNNYGFLAEVEKGAELASLEAAIAGKDTSYNRISTTVTYRTAQTRPVSGFGLEALYIAVDPVAIPEYTVQYTFADNCEDGLQRLVDLYRSSLEQKGITQKKTEIEPSLNIDLYCGIQKKKSFFGFIHTGNVPITTYKQAQTIISDFTLNGATNLNVNLLQYNKDYFKRNLQTSLKPAGFLGKKSDFKKLISDSYKNGIALYLSENMSVMPTSGNGYSTLWDVLSGLTFDSITYKPYSLNTDYASTTAKPVYFVKTKNFSKIMKEVNKSVKAYEVKGIHFVDENTWLSSDFTKSGYQRDRAKAEYIKAFEIAKETGAKLSFSYPNDYMLPFADFISDLPVSSSKYVLFDEDVPFYQMAVMGSIGYSGKAINVIDPSREYFLSHLETGTSLKYALHYNDEPVILDTDYGGSAGSSYKVYLSDAIEKYKEMDSLYRKIGGSRIISFKRQGLVSIIRYSNNITLYINHGSEDREVDGVHIKATSYTVV
jgi:hypothetical protein